MGRDCTAFLTASWYHMLTSPADNKLVVQKEKRHFIGTMLMWLCLLTFLLYHDKSTSFLPLLWVAGPFISRGIIGEYLLPSSNIGFHIVKAYTLTAVGVLLVLALTLNSVITFVDVIIPITARMGNRNPCEVMIAVLVTISTLLSTSYFIPLTVYIHRKVFTLVSSILISVTFIFFILAITQTIFPYSMKPESPKPKRLYVSYITTESSIQGNLPENYLWVIPGDWLDIKPILETKQTMLDQAELVECNTSDLIPDCPMSLFVPLFSKLSNTYFIKVRDRNKVTEPILKQLNTTEEGGKVKLAFSVEISYRAVMLMTTREGVEMTDWSFAGVPSQIALNDGTLLYFFHMSCGFDPCVNEFWLELQGFDKSKVNIDIGVNNQWTNEKSEVLQDFRREMPEWVDTVTWLTNYKTWKF